MSIDNQGTSGGASSPSSVEERAKQDLSNTTETLRQDLDAVTERAAKDAEALKREAQSHIGAATEQAKSFASDQKDFAADQINGVAAAIARVADELEGDQATTARYARDLAQGLERFGGTVKGKNVDDLMGMAQQFGRSQPLAFLGAAALAGFVASRFAGASAQRRAAPQQPSATGGVNATSSQTSPGAQSGSGYSSAYAQSGSAYPGGTNVTGQ